MIEIFFEGSRTGPNSRSKQKEARAALGSFVDKLRLNRKPRLKVCGNRNDAFSDFCQALMFANPSYLPILLVDSEAPFLCAEKDASKIAAARWAHLLERDGWSRPESTQDEQVFLMVQCMESWFLADADALQSFYRGETFHAKHVAGITSVEGVSKNDVMKKLKDATAHCARKGGYSKGRHSWRILELLDPEKVGNASPEAARFLACLRRECV